MAQETRYPVVSLIEEDPVQAIRNAVARIRMAKERAVSRADHGAVMVMGSVVDEELAVVEQALHRLEPS